MKKFIFTLFVCLLFIDISFSQAPQAINYQAVVRDTSGAVISNQGVSLKISILTDSITGAVVYSETHNPVTNALGLVNIAIGTGQVVTGDFSAINWGISKHFIKTEADVAGGSNYVLMGISQFLSVPYALNASSLILTSPSGGTYEVTVDDNGNLVTTCKPQPTQADAGPDQQNVCSPATLSANIPLVGNGEWSIVSGSGGAFSDNTAPDASFIGIPGSEYTLVWIISNVCGNSSDTIKITFSELPTNADAGPDILNIPVDSIILQGNTPATGQGLWTIHSGTGGTLDDPLNPSTTFYGIAGMQYELVWTISNNCGSSSDTVIIHFEVTYPDCGIITDQRDGQEYKTVLIGNQCWMRENLNYGTRLDSNICAANNGVAEKYCYGDQEINCDNFGGLYSWNELMEYQGYNNAQGLCPEGWRVPTRFEWDTLIERVNNDANALKAIGVGDPPYGVGTNISGFSAFLNGSLSSCNGSYNGMGNITVFYTRSTPSGWPTIRWILNNDSIIYGGAASPGHAYSVRCVKDTTSCSPLPDQADAGPDQLDVTADSVILAANTPVEGQGLWSVASGNGGSFNDPTNPATTFYGLADSTYYLVWTISNICGSTSDTVIIGFAGQDFTCGDPFIDNRDGNIYSTVQIGSQCWMAENLAYLPVVYPSDSGSLTSPYYYVYDYQGTDISVARSTSNYHTYGVLYNWPAAMAGEASSDSVPSGVQGVCPTAWHLPSDEEWKILEGEVDSQYGYPDPEWDNAGYRGTDAGDNLKETGTTHWSAPNTGATNSSGFTALPCGRRHSSNGTYDGLGSNAYFWSTSDYGGQSELSRNLSYNYANVGRYGRSNNSGLSVRCLMDSVQSCNPEPDQADAGPDQLDVTADSVILAANTPSEGLGLWFVASGNGGSFTDPTNPSTAFYGLADSTYYLVWTISNNCGSTSDTVIISFASQAFVCGNPLIDNSDGKSYNTVEIGGRCWMAENLNVGNRLDGINDQSDNGTIEKYCYNDLEAYCDTLGGLYQWDEVMNYNPTKGGQGICPDGWHVPTDYEWKLLEGTVDSQFPVGDPEWDIVGWRGYDAGKNLKDNNTWLSGTGVNNFGFTALGAGRRDGSGNFGSKEVMTYYWISKESDSSNAWSRYLRDDYDNIRSSYFNKTDGRSVRCIMNCTPQPDQADAGLDQLNVTADSVILAANAPVNGQGIWSVASGNGGSFTDATNPTTTFYGLADSSYYLVWSISNLCSISTDTVIISFASQTFTCGDPFIDNRDGNIYTTVQIGSQCWIAKNLNIGDRIDGVNDQPDNGTIEKYCYDDLEAYCDTFGGLYQWDEMMQYNPSDNGAVGSTQGICPDNWHLPTAVEWDVLANYLGGPGVAGGAMKEIGTAHWNSPNAGATNSSGFTALPAGDRWYSNGNFIYLGEYGYFWAATEDNSNDAIHKSLQYVHDDLGTLTNPKSFGFSVRCVKDTTACTPLPDQSDAGPDQLNIAADSVILAANTPSEGQGLWSVANGNGGSFNDVSDPSAAFYGLADSTYYLVWTISNNCGSTADTVIISFASQAFVCGSPLIDIRDGILYNTVEIGNRCWLAENLNIGNRIDGASDQTNNGVLEKYCYDDLEAYCDTFGGLYQWDEMMNYISTEGGQGICPAGWHVPNDFEWKLLEGTVDSQFPVGDPEWDIVGWRGFDAGKNLKDNNTWNSATGINSFGFSALSAGRRDNAGAYGSKGYMTYLWISKEFDLATAWSRYLRDDYDNIRSSYFDKMDGRSVRCIQDCSPLPDQANAGQDQLNVAGDSVVLSANTPAEGQGAWSIAGGNGGYFVNSADPNTAFYGLADNTYYLVWSISNLCNISTDTVIISFAAQAFSCGDSLVDQRDGKKYATVQIGTQCWMAQNLNVGSVIDNSVSQTDNGVIEKYCSTNGVEDSCNVYGGLYQWDEMMDHSFYPGTQGICPDGWIIPTDDDWKILEGTVDSQYGVGDQEWENSNVYRGYDVGKKLKSTSIWINNGAGTDEFGFSVKPSFSSSMFTYFWSSSQDGISNSWVRKFQFDEDGVFRRPSSKTYSDMVRCLKD